MTKNEDISKPFKVIERQTLEVENFVEKNNYFTIIFFSQLYTQLDTCQTFHPYSTFSMYSDSVNFQVLTITQRDQQRDHPVTRDSQSPM